jgi:hypothetical protein
MSLIPAKDGAELRDLPKAAQPAKTAPAVAS